MKQYGHESVMVSMIEMTKEHCITKEKFDIAYEINDEKKNSTENRERGDLSVGEDLEAFMKRIKNGNYSTRKQFREKKLSHLLKLLDKEERRKLRKKDETFFKMFYYGNDADVDEEEWKKTEFKHLKYSRTTAYRETFFIQMNQNNESHNDSFEILHDQALNEEMRDELRIDLLF